MPSAVAGHRGIRAGFVFGRDARQGAESGAPPSARGRGTVVRSTSRRWVMSTTTHISSVSGSPARLADQVKSSLTSPLSRVISRVPASLVSKSVSHCALWPAAFRVMSPPTQVTGAALVIRSPFAHPTGGEPAMVADGFTDRCGSGRSALATCCCFRDRARRSRSIPRISRTSKVWPYKVGLRPGKYLALSFATCWFCDLGGS
jgi:hypothetical protein